MWLRMDGNTLPLLRPLAASGASTPAPMPGLESDVTDIWAGYFSTCARRKDGSVWCWGSDLGFSTTPKPLAAGCN